MPVRHWIDREHRLIRAEVSGSTSIEQMQECIRDAICHADFQIGFNVYSDHTRVTEIISTEQVRQLSSQLSLFKSQMKNAKWAVVTNSAASVGMMRMLGTYLEQIPITLRIFTSPEDALAWLGVQAPGEDG